MQKKLTIISNLENEDAKTEDAELARLLGQYFCTKVVDLSEDFVVADDQFFLIRNIWGRPRPLMLDLYKKLEKSNYLNPSTGKADQKGKTYLVDLYAQGYPAVPTFQNPQDAVQYESEHFLFKPLYGASSKGIKKVTAKELLTEKNVDLYIIQPYFDLSYETSFFYIDNQFQYALKTKSERWELEIYEPHIKELETAQMFVGWNPMQGIQRIDFLHDTDGQQWLLEMEDWCPYLSLCDVDDIPVDKFTYNLSESIKSYTRK